MAGIGSGDLLLVTAFTPFQPADQSAAFRAPLGFPLLDELGAGTINHERLSSKHKVSAGFSETGG
jgi:hypothetical protein